MNINQALSRYLNDDSTKNAIEFNQHWYSRGEFKQAVEGFEALLQQHNVKPLESIAFIARNLPSHAVAIASLVANNRPISMIYAFQASELKASDISKLKSKVVLGSNSDFSDEVVSAAKSLGCLGIILDDGLAPKIHPELSQINESTTWRTLPESGVEILSSGTTGSPKRIFHPTAMLLRTVQGVPEAQRNIQHIPDIILWPFGGIGGVCQLMGSMIINKPAVLAERFSVDEFVRAVKTYGITAVGLTPTMIRMIYDADVAPEDLASLSCVYGGSGPLDDHLLQAFEEKYQIPLLWAMGATEFCGTIASWNMDLKQQYGNTKLGSCGKPLAGVDIRIVDAITKEELPVGEIGCMEARLTELGMDWLHTTDLAKFDEDGFLYLVGRNDNAIIRGGFKVIPERVNEVLRQHPDISDAAVIGIDDHRLGKVPVAAITLKPNAAKLSDEALSAFLRKQLASPQIPVKFHTLKAMPYTASTKVDLKTLRTMIS